MEKKKMIKNSPRLLIIGIDGGALDLILPWVEQGKLPNLAKLLDEGVHGQLQSTTHPITPTAWATFMTGKNAGKHGVFDFFELVGGEYDLRRTNGGSCKSKTIWRMMSDSGKKVGIYNMPFTYPPEEINGFVISGFDADRISLKMAYPRTLYKEIVKELGGFAPWSPRKTLGTYRIEDIDNIIKDRTKISKYLLENKTLDVFSMVYNAVDKVQHIFWKDRSLQNGHRKIDDVILYTYQKVDEAIGELIKTAGDSTVMVVSDHGAGELKRGVSLNRWLEQEGLLQYKNGSGLRSKFSNLYQHAIVKSTSLMTKYLPSSLVDPVLRSPIRKLLTNIILNSVPRSQTFSSVDFPQTKAFSWEPWGYGNIQINVKGRFPQGVVEPGEEYEKTRDLIIKNLVLLKDPEDGKPIIDKVYKREEIYNGDFVHKAPDLIVIPRDYAYPVGNMLGFQSNKIFPDSSDIKLLKIGGLTGIHRPEGIFIVRGKNIKKGVELQGLKIEDMAPTILRLMGEEIPEDMDGRVLEEIFDA